MRAYLPYAFVALLVLLLLLSSLPFLIRALFAVPLFITFLMEKQYVRFFKPAALDTLPADFLYMGELNRQAGELGYRFGGIYRVERGKNTSGYACLWLSPSLDTLLYISQGKVFGMTFRKTILTSRRVDNCIFKTTDDFGVWDPTGLSETEVLKNADLRELQPLHQQRIIIAGPLKTFDQSNPLAEMETMEAARVQKLADMGLAHFVDAHRNFWRYTLKGAFRLTFEGHTRQIEQGKQQMHRLHVKRPGD